jgi:hypothetical protein
MDGITGEQAGKVRQRNSSGSCHDEPGPGPGPGHLCLLLQWKKVDSQMNVNNMIHTLVISPYWFA